MTGFVPSDEMKKGIDSTTHKTELSIFAEKPSKEHLIGSLTRNLTVLTLRNLLFVTEIVGRRVLSFHSYTV